jgi:hypothetical protein
VSGDLTLIPNFLEARSLKGLRALMLKNNLAKGKAFRYFDIQKDGTNWIAFFLEDALEEALNAIPPKAKGNGTTN